MIEKRNSIVQKSLMHLGNNARAKEFIKKVESGKEVTVLFVGGSVTQGYLVEEEQNFPFLVGEYVKKRYGESKANIINDGLAGTDSLYGLVKAEQNIKSLRPDLVFVEYAINDRKEALYRTAFESMVVKYLKSDSEPCVVLLFLKSGVGYTCKGHMKQVGLFYQLPMLGIGDALFREIADGGMEWNDYSEDEAHPNPNGHRLISACVTGWMEEIRKGERLPAYSLPQGCRYGNAYKDLKILPIEDWNHEKKEVRLRFRALFILFIEDDKDDTGSADVYVDGECKTTLQGYSVTGWGRPIVKPVMEDGVAKERDVKILMVKEGRRKTIQLVCFGIA